MGFEGGKAAASGLKSIGTAFAVFAAALLSFTMLLLAAPAWSQEDQSDVQEAQYEGTAEAEAGSKAGGASAVAGDANAESGNQVDTGDEQENANEPGKEQDKSRENGKEDEEAGSLQDDPLIGEVLETNRENPPRGEITEATIDTTDFGPCTVDEGATITVFDNDEKNFTVTDGDNADITAETGTEQGETFILISATGKQIFKGSEGALIVDDQTGISCSGAGPGPGPSPEPTAPECTNAEVVAEETIEVPGGELPFSITTQAALVTAETFGTGSDETTVDVLDSAGVPVPGEPLALVGSEIGYLELTGPAGSYTVNVTTTQQVDILVEQCGEVVSEDPVDETDDDGPLPPTGFGSKDEGRTVLTAGILASLLFGGAGLAFYATGRRRRV